MIKSFACKDTESLYHRKRVLRFQPIEKSARIKLALLNNAALLQDLSVIPGLKLEKLKHNRTGQYSIRINDQWRICFEYKSDGIYNVEIIDYH